LYRAQYTPGGQGYSTGQAYGNQPGGGGQGQATQGYGAGPGDGYILSGYARPVGQQQAQPNPQGYYTQPNAGYPGMASAPTSVAGAPKVQQQVGPRPAASSTAYPTYSANTAGTTNSTSYAGFTPPPMKMVGGKMITIARFIVI